MAEALVRDLVAQVRHSQRAEEKMRQLLSDAFADLPASPHVQVVTIPGIGEATAAVLVAKIVDIDRFATPAHFVGYFGVFPEENSSGVDKHGKPLPPGTLRMSRKGNDLVRHYLWNAARAAIRHNPAIRALYRRLKAKGKRGDVALGHCMRKLLHLVFAVWKTNRPFDDQHFAAEPPSDAVPQPQPADRSRRATRRFGRRTGTSDPPSDSPLSGLATPAPRVIRQRNSRGPQTGLARRRSGHHGHATVAPTPPPVKPAPPANRPARPKVDFAFLRQQVTHGAGLCDTWVARQPCAAAASNAAGPARSTATPTTRSPPSRPTSARTSFSASTPIAAPRATCWTCGPPSIACRCTRPPCIWQKPSMSHGTEKRNPSKEPVKVRRTPTVATFTCSDNRQPQPVKGTRQPRNAGTVASYLSGRCLPSSHANGTLPTRLAPPAHDDTRP